MKSIPVQIIIREAPLFNNEEYTDILPTYGIPLPVALIDYIEGEGVKALGAYSITFDKKIFRIKDTIADPNNGQALVSL